MVSIVLIRVIVLMVMIFAGLLRRPPAGLRPDDQGRGRKTTHQKSQKLDSI